jgi:hypothetical protein
MCARCGASLRRRSRPRPIALWLWLAPAWAHWYGQAAQPAADRSAQRLRQRRRWAAPAASWAARPRSCPPWWGQTRSNGRYAFAPTIRPPGGKVVGTGSAALRPCHWFLSPPTPSRGRCWGGLRVRWVAVLTLQAPASPSTRCARRPGSASHPPPTRRRPRPRAPAANPARLALAAGGASAPVCPPGGAQAAQIPARPGGIPV